MINDDAVTIYLRNIKGIPLLSREREYELSVIKNDPNSSQDQVDAAINELIIHNLRFVILLAKRRSNKVEDLAEIICDGNEGLVTAARNFDASKGHDRKGRFTTYAIWWIKRHIRDGLRKRSNKIVTIPRNQWDDCQSVKMDKDKVLSKRRSKNAKDVEAIHVDSMNDETSLIFDILDTNALDPSLEAERIDLLDFVDVAIKSLGLDEDEKKLIFNHGDEGATHVKLMAKKRGVTTSRIRMLKKEIIWKLKRRILSTLGEEEYIRLSGEKLSSDWRKQKTKNSKKS